MCRKPSENKCANPKVRQTAQPYGLTVARYGQAV